MSLGDRLEDALARFEEVTDGVLGTSVISASQALMMAGSSKNFDRDIIQGMSVKFLQLANETMEKLANSTDLDSVTVEEDNLIVFIRTINQDYYLVAITDKSETAGLRISNLDSLIEKLSNIIG